MTYQPFLVANARVGKELDLAPWLLADDAFPELLNAYLYRGVIRKKGGTTLLGRLGIRNPTLVASRGAGNTTVALSLAGAPIQPGTIVITDGTTTFSDNGTGGFVITGGTGTVNAPTNYTTGAINITFTTANPGAAITATYFVAVNNNSPVMGLCTREINLINNNALVAFDLIHAYQYNNSSGQFVDISTYKQATGQTTTNNVVWTGNNSNFFNYENFQRALFVTNNVIGSNFYAITAITNAASAQVTTSVANNFAIGDVVYFNNVGGMTQINNLTGVVTANGNPFTVNINSAGFSAYTSGGIAWSQTLSASGAGDGIRWYDGTGWVNFEPPLDNSTNPVILQGALLLFAYKGRLVALNTFEGTAGNTPTNFAQRARFSQNGNVFYAPPFPTGGVTSTLGNGWYTSSGLGGFVDAPTSEVIVSAEFIKDTLVVFFERSTYRLVYTQNAAAPFKWEKVNTEIGCEATNSVVPFDKEVLMIGTNGVYACDSVNVERIDQKIPDEVFNFGEANNGIARIQGVRDYYNQFTYWTYVDASSDAGASLIDFPNKILAYNYKDGSWATFQNYFTCFGHYQTTGNNTWGNTNLQWNQMTVPWNSGALQVQFPTVIAGNQQGFVHTLNLVSGNNMFPMGNAPSLVVQGITNAVPSVFTCPNYNLPADSYIFITSSDVLAINNTIFRVVPIDANTFSLLDANGNPVNNVNSTTQFALINTVENFQIQTKKFTPFIESGQKNRVGYVDVFFEVDEIEDQNAPDISVFLLENEEYTDPIIQKTVSLVDQFSAESDRFWRRIYLNSTQQSFSLLFAYSDPNIVPNQQNYQIFDPFNMFTSVGIHGLIFWIAQAGRLVR